MPYCTRTPEGGVGGRPLVGPSHDPVERVVVGAHDHEHEAGVRRAHRSRPISCARDRAPLLRPLDAEQIA